MPSLSFLLNFTSGLGSTLTVGRIVFLTSSREAPVPYVRKWLGVLTLMGVAILLMELLLLPRQSVSGDGVGETASSVNDDSFLEFDSFDTDGLRRPVRSSALRIVAADGR